MDTRCPSCSTRSSDFFPLDTFVDSPVALMEVGAEAASEPAIWQTYREIVDRRSPDAAGMDLVERFAFYERAKQTYAIVATGESALYANVILTKGVVVDS